MENIFLNCGSCPFFKTNHCNLTLLGCSCDDECYFLSVGHDIDYSCSAKILSYFQKWRRGGIGKQPSGFLVGIALDNAIYCLRNINK